LAKESINIGALSLGRASKGSNAITAVAVDRKLSQEETQNIQGMDGVKALRFISLS
jgi:D-3-phosphoglycerate dehydrogenase